MIKIIAFILYIPHLVLFSFSKEKEVIIADLYSKNILTSYSSTNIFGDLALRLFKDRYFRTLFYFRTSCLCSKILRIFYRQDPYFIIDINTVLGKGVILAHPYSTILNAERIGENLYINHLVTVGEISGKKPIIGNNVQLHTGAVVIGGITIGDNVIVGAGAIVVKSVPENCTVVGNPAKIIKCHN